MRPDESRSRLHSFDPAQRSPAARGVRLGDRVRLEPGEYLNRPPVGTLWHQASGDDAYVLRAEGAPLRLQRGDVVGVRPGDVPPDPPFGLQMTRVAQAGVPATERAKAAALYKVVDPPMHAQAVVAPPGWIAARAPAAQAMDPGTSPRPGPNQTWQVIGANGRDLAQLMAIPRSGIQRGAALG